MDYIFYIPGVILLATVASKLPALKRTWRDPLILSSTLVLTLGGLVCVLSGPPTIRVINSLTGISNFSAPLVYSGMSALSAAYLILMTTWRGGPPDAVRRTTLMVVRIYGLVIVGIVILFSLADVPVERIRDLDTYYATTPYMREMILLYMVSHTAASLRLTAMCLSWLREVRDLTRTGLTMIVIGGIFDLSYQAVKYTAMASRWCGYNLDFLSTDVSPPLVALAGVTVAAGFALPRVGPSAAENHRAWKRYRLLRPLVTELRTLTTPPKAKSHWWDLPVVRLTRQEISILDGLLECTPYLDDAIRKAAYGEALAQTSNGALAAGSSSEARAGWKILQTTPTHRMAPDTASRPDHQNLGEQEQNDRAHIVAEAAMLAAACARISRCRDAQVPLQVGTLKSAQEPQRMIALAQALFSSPIVAAARQRAVLEGVGHD